MPRKPEEQKKRSPRILNRKARHDYHITEVVECGMELRGTEVKSLRAGQAQIDEAYVRVRSGEAYLIGSTITHYPLASAAMQHETTRDRRLLLHARQIAQIESHVRVKGKTCVPLAVYFKHGWAKCEVGLAVGKRSFDKREDIKARDHKREMDRELRRRHKGD